MDVKNLNDQVVREFKLTTLSLKNINSVYVIITIIVFFGLYSYVKMHKELFPEIVWPQIMVQTVYPGNSPADIENLITRPLEKEIDGVRGMKEITSISAQDASMIFVEFNTDVELEDALQRVKDRVDRARAELPNDPQMIDPIVFDIDFSEFPILNINLSGDYSVEELKNYAEYLEDQMEEVPEISKVTIEGINEKEVKVNVDMVKMEAFDLTFFDITSAIAAENISMSGGEILLGDTRRSLSVNGEFKNVKEIGNIIVKREGDMMIYLKDIADVVYGYQEPNSFARLDKQAVVSVQVIKKGGENLLSATDKVLKVIDKAKEDRQLPENLKISITNDQSEMVRAQLANLENSIIMGVILVIAVLFFFLGIRNAVLVGIAIPMSMFLSFLVINAIGFQINMMVLFALILALGMLVDNAIVATENIYRYVDSGYTKFEAAKRAVGEIAVPIITSTMTTLAAFLPLAFWTGIMGEFMKYLPITLIIVLSASLFVALVITPVNSLRLMKLNKDNVQSPETKKKGLRIAGIMILAGILFVLIKKPIFGNLLALFGILGILYHAFLHKTEKWFQEIFLVKLERLYERTLKFALRKRNPYWFLGGTFAMLIFTIVMYGMRNDGVVLFPSGDPNYLNIVAETPIGTDITGTNKIVHQIEDDIIDFLKPDSSIVESILTTVGKGDPNDFSSGNMPNKALITVSFIDYEFRDGKNTSDIQKGLSDLLLNQYPGVEIQILKENMGPPSGKPVNIEISGQDYKKLVYLADTIQAVIEMANIDGIEGLKLDISTDKPELQISIDRDKAKRYGLSTQQIAYDIRTALFGSEASQFKEGEDEYPVNVRLKDEYRYNLSAIENLKIIYIDNGQAIEIPVSAIAEFEYTSTFSSVRRKNLDRVVTVYSNVIEGFNPNVVNQQIASVLKSFEMPVGYQFEFTGEQQEQQESSDFLMNALLIALALIFLILVSQFNSVVKPLIIMTSVIFSTIGVFGAFATFKMEFIIIMTGIGIISLAGIVVNNAIVLIDYIELLKARKRKEMDFPEDAFLPVDVATDCVVTAGKTRLRPVLLTAITTLLGLVPMAVGMNFDFAGFFREYKPNIYFGGDQAAFWSNMSWTVIFGLTFSTFLTLVIVPVMYRITVNIQKKMKGFKEGMKGFAYLKRNGNGNSSGNSNENEYSF